jgi:hypothetical protein
MAVSPFHHSLRVGIAPAKESVMKFSMPTDIDKRPIAVIGAGRMAVQMLASQRTQIASNDPLGGDEDQLPIPPVSRISEVTK